MSDLVRQIVTGVVESVVKELLGKSHGKTASKRRKRQARTTEGRSATTGRFVKKTTRTRAAKPAKKQVSKRRSTASRSKQRSR
ncbi:hypothetical protein N7E02_26320 [Aliirhizobium terrae]|uniref:hypothetical protein n=1 Tax=Terrirhizobium terrae TaxID=2926709 RepID=UPI002576AB4A|nr:hypothetical protein [Rhizobium sp. CC-CFT758]WJH40119.1 hypothetical protein N7E02_26320 [Rhizobium sp. CC-CFT758]